MIPEEAPMPRWQLRNRLIAMPADFDQLRKEHDDVAKRLRAVEAYLEQLQDALAAEEEE